MLNQYSWWKYLIIGLVIIIGVIYASPNLFGNDPAVQISARRSAAVDQALYGSVLARLDQEKLAYKSAELSENRLLVRFNDTETQLKAADALREDLGADYVVAHNLAPSTPGFMQALNLNPMFLGLDLRGGIHFLMQVDMDAVIKQAEESYLDTVRSELRGDKVRYATVSRKDSGGILITFRDSGEQGKARDALKDELPDLQVQEVGADLLLTLSEQEIEQKRTNALQQNITTLRNRVNELGVAEPVIQRQGEERIVVQLPGVQDTAQAKRILGATATLEFRMVDETNDPLQAERSGRIPLGSRLYRERNGQPILLQRQIMLTGEYITDAASGLDQQTGGPAVFISLDSKGGRRFENATKDNIGKLLAVVYIESKVAEVINVATIRDRLGRRFQITGLDSTNEARDLALLLRAGSLAAPMEIIEERTVGPSAGADNIRQGFYSAIVAFGLVLVFMAFYYRRFGLISDLALVVNVVLIIAVLSMLQATLTLPGIAGIILTMGMAVDANVLIFERIREELQVGNTPQASIHTGFDKAFSTILDANITTLIAAMVLFGLGTGPVKGFAVTLSIGILTSMFTAIMGARGMINYTYGKRRLETLPI